MLNGSNNKLYNFNVNVDPNENLLKFSAPYKSHVRETSLKHLGLCQIKSASSRFSWSVSVSDKIPGLDRAEYAG